MSRRRTGACGLAILVLGGLLSHARAADRPTLLDAEALARRIDHHLAARQAARGVPPAPLSDDAEFIRRVYLDLVGCIPSIIDARDFLDDRRPDKRRIWVDMLLDGRKPNNPDAFNQHFANVWRAWILSRASTQNRENLAEPAETWLRERLRANTPYDRMVRELIAGKNGDGSEVAAGFFDQVNEGKAESLAASASRLFLGIKLECAQCHDDRSGGSWSQGQFWSFAAFFPDNGEHEIAIPGKKKVARARFLDGSTPAWKAGLSSRTALADWLTSADNPYFARAAVNRMWSYFFGLGLTDPIDEQGRHNPPSHPELLPELAQQFAAHHFDLRYLMRAIVASQAYQRTSAASHPGQDDPRLFARMRVRGLSAEQMFDSLAEATEYQDASPPMRGRFRTSEALTPREQFLAQLSHEDRPSDAATSILQALYLMNSSFIADRTSLEQNKTLATLAAQKGPDQRRIDSLFLAVLSRKPTAAEARRCLDYLAAGGSTGDRREALADIFWALLNSAEFRLNH